MANKEDQSIHPDLVNRDVALLYTPFNKNVQKCVDECNRLGYPLQIFEGWRSPQRQEWLYAAGRTREGKISTNARGWDSWHQYGLAVDLALLINGRWSWDFDFAKVAPIFAAEELVWGGAWGDKDHFEAAPRITTAVARGLALNSGTQRVWLEYKD